MLFDATKIIVGDGMDFNEAALAAAFRSLSNRVNCFVFNLDKDIDEQMQDADNRYLAFVIALAWIRFWGQADRSMIDGRNETAAEICKEIRELPGFEELRVFYLNKDTAFEKAAGRVTTYSWWEHRTLMQSETAVMLKIFSKMKDRAVNNICQKMAEKYGSSWFDLPLV